MSRDELFAAKLNLFPEVAWDRWSGWYDYPGEDKGIAAATAYGWIDRADNRSDFLVLTGFHADGHGLYHTAFATSSADLSEEFARRLDLLDGHQDCQRIEYTLGELVHRKVVIGIA